MYIILNVLIFVEEFHMDYSRTKFIPSATIINSNVSSIYTYVYIRNVIFNICFYIYVKYLINQLEINLEIIKKKEQLKNKDYKKIYYLVFQH